MPERDTVTAVLRYLGNRPDCKVWRNNTGAIPDKTGRVVRFGLVGSADIIGIQKRFVQAPRYISAVFDAKPCEVGALIGRFIAVECKSAKGKQTSQQAAFERMVRSMGGLYLLVRDVSDLYAEFPPL